MAQSTQENPAPRYLQAYRELLELFARDALIGFLGNKPEEINKYADDPAPPDGTGLGFLKPEFHGPDFLRSNLLRSKHDDDKADPDNYLGMVAPDQHSQLEEAANRMYDGSRTDNAQEMIKQIKALGVEGIAYISDAMDEEIIYSGPSVEDDPAASSAIMYLPERTLDELAPGFPDGGSTRVNGTDFNLMCSMVVQGAGAYRDFSLFGGAPSNAKIGTFKFEVLWRAGKVDDEYEFIPVTKSWLANNPPDMSFWGGSFATWAEIDPKYKTELLTKRLSEDYKKDDIVFHAKDSTQTGVRGAKSSTELIGRVIKGISRNHPTMARSVIDEVIADLIMDRVSEEIVDSRIEGTNEEDTRAFIPKPPPPPPPEPEPERELQPIDLQCFLMENIGLLADFKKAQANPYENLMQLYGENAPGETISILNCKGKHEEVKRLLNLTPSTYASLVPYIKLYRLSYTNADDADPLVPIAQQEIPIPNYMDPADISRITSGQLGRNSGWGLQSFTWKLDGLQPATVDNNISANLKLYFQSVDDLFKGSRNASGRDQAGRAQPGPLDLLIPSEACRKSDDDDDDPPIGSPPPPPTCGVESQQAKSQGRDGACFRIKVVAGWATPPNLEETHPELKKKAGGSHETEGEILRRALRDTRITLYLQQTRHNLSFNENGSVLLSIDYQAALSGILTDNRMDILGTNDSAIQAKLKELKAKAKGAAGEMETIAGRYGNTKEDLKSLRDDAAYKAQKEKQKEYLQKQIDLQNQDKLKKYKRFLSRLYGRHEGGMSQSPKMYVMEVDPKLVRQKKLADEKDPEVRAKRARQLMTNSSAARGWAITNPLTYEEGKSGKNSDLLELLEGVDSLEEASEASNGMSEQFQNNLYSGKNMYIPYFYLGDLIDSILQNNDSLRSNKRKSASNFGVFLAEMHVTNPLLLYQAPEKEQTQLMCASYDSIDSSKLLRQLKAKGYIFDGGVKKRINIGEIPIALDEFNVWFKNKVVKGGLDSYYLLHFIKDICAQLITDALKTTCFNNNIINDIRFDVSHIHFNNRKADGGAHYPNGPKHTVPIPRLANLMGSADTLHRDVPPVGTPAEELSRYNITSGLVLFCTDAKPRNRRGRKAINSDREVGIYHNYVGSPVGLLKKLTFSRIQQQYLRESKLQKFGNLGAEQLRELYSANLELVGNTLYKNGQYTFLWPSAMTSGDDSRIVNLGLGGYFLIKSVDHTISPSGYTVRMTALQEGMEIGDEAQVKVGPVDGDISPDTNPYFTTEDGRALAAWKAEQAATAAAAAEAERIAAAAAARALEQQSAEATAERARAADTSMDVAGEEVDIARGTNKETLEAIQKRHQASPSTPGSRTSYSSTGQRRQS